MAPDRPRRTGWSTAAHAVVDRMFVYGTLRRGHAARSLIAEHIGSSVPATMRGHIFALPEGYPGMHPGVPAGASDDGAVVVGEMIQLVDLAAALALLDAYEGEEFTRMLRQATTRDGAMHWTWCYVLSDPALAEAGVLIASGDWNEHCALG